MPINLDQLRQLVASVVRERNVAAEVVGVMPGTGDGCYTEVILEVFDGPPARRVTLGVQRDVAPDDLRNRISEALTANLSRSIS